MPSPNIADFASDAVKLGGSDSVPAICVRNLLFSYAGSDAAVLHGVDWTVEQGAFALLVGNTGTGKSTLLSLLKPEISPTGALAGNIEVFGRELSSLSSRESAQEVGYVFQDPENQIICESVWHEMAFGLENLGESQDEMRRRIAETCYFFGMDDWFRAETDTLSGGRKQLLALAATLVMRPRLLLLDEPTAMLDPVAEKNFLHALFRVNRELGCTVVVATHRPRPMLEYATCAFRMRGGAVEKIDDLQELDGRRPLLARDAAVDVEGVGGAGGSEETAGRRTCVSLRLLRILPRNRMWGCVMPPRPHSISLAHGSGTVEMAPGCFATLIFPLTSAPCTPLWVETDAESPRCCRLRRAPINRSVARCAVRRGRARCFRRVQRHCLRGKARSRNSWNGRGARAMASRRRARCSAILVSAIAPAAIHMISRAGSSSFLLWESYCW